MNQHPERLPGLDLLRAIAIATVMLYHVTSYGVRLPAWVEFGWIGVDLFFVLSGFLIGGQVLAPYTRGEAPLWSRFLARRAWRVLPAYLAVVALYFAAPGVRESAAIAPLWQFLTFTQNIFPDYFHARALSHAWSLCVEEHFYLMLPPVVWLMARKPTPARIMAAVFLTLVGGMALRAWIWEHDVAPFVLLTQGEGNYIDRYIEKLYNPTYARLDGLLAGLVLALVRAFRPLWWQAMTARGWWFAAAGVAGVVGATRLQTPGYAGAVLVFPLLGASFAALLVACASGHTWIGRLRIPGVAPLAAMAFSLYLTNKMSYHLVRTYLGASLPDSNLGLLGAHLAAALGLGTLLYLAVERPGLRLRDRLYRLAPDPDQRTPGFLK